MKQSFRQSMAWLHTSSGLVFCWVFYFIFATGSLGYFNKEIDQWMMPELPQIASNATAESDLQAVNVAVSWLQENAPQADSWFIRPPNHRSNHHLRVIANTPASRSSTGEKQSLNKRLDIRNGQVLEPRDTGGGNTLYRMHYVLHYLPTQLTYQFVGLLAMIMFIALATGIIIHRNFFKDFFTFRPSKGNRTWLDAHNLMAVSTLPFQLMITYSGMVFVIGMWMPAVAGGNLGFNAAEVQKAYFELNGEPISKRSDEPATLAPLQPILEVALRTIGRDNFEYIQVKHPNDVGAQVIISEHHNQPSRFRQKIFFDGVSGELIQHNQSSPSFSKATYDAIQGLHEANFAGIGLRWLYFLSGLAGMGVIATGAIYWSLKRKKQFDEMGQSPFNYRLVNRLNIGVIAGLPIAIAAYFWANRLLPVEMSSREDWETHSMFIVWLLATLHPLLRSNENAWREQLWAAGFAYTFIPVISAATTSRHLLASIEAGDWVFAGFDLTVLATGLLFLTAAWNLNRKKKLAA